MQYAATDHTPSRVSTHRPCRAGRLISLFLCVVLIVSSAATALAAETYTVTYYNDGVMIDQSHVPAGSAVQVRTKVGLVKSGCSFAGWATKPDAAVAEYVYPANITPSRDMALHAVWLDDHLNDADARYTVVRNYYIDGEKRASYVQNEVSTKAGTVIVGADIAANNADWRTLVMGDQIWSFILSGSQPARLTLTAGSNLITLRYDASTSVSNGPTGSAMYTVIRDYFINGARAAQVTEQQVAANAGDILSGEQVAEAHPAWKKMTLDGVTWSFVYSSSTPERFILEEGHNAITIKYNAVGTSEPAASETTTRIVRNYFIDGQLRDSVTENAMPATAGDIIDCTRIGEQHPEWKYQVIEDHAWMFQFSGANPAVLDVVRGENTIALRYDTELAATSGRTVYYNANLGHGQAPPPQKVGEGGVVVAQSADSLYRTGYLFAGWALSPHAETAAYYPGQAFSPSANITLYAMWTPNGALTGSAQYSIVRYYFINGKEVMGLSEPAVCASVGETLVAAQIAAANPAWKTYAHDGQAYAFEFTEGSPDQVVLTNGLNTITLRYDAVGSAMPSATDRVGYTVIRNYYVDGHLLTGIAENEYTGRKGDVITSANIAASNPAWNALTQDGRMWDFVLAKASPERLVLADGQNTVTLTYNATGSHPVYVSGDAQYTVERNYYVNGNLVASIEEEPVAAGSGDTLTGKQIAAVNPSWKSVSVGHKAWLFECTLSEPDMLTLVSGPNKIVLRFDAIANSEYDLSATYTVIREYYLNNTKVASYTEPDLFGIAGEVIKGSQIAADHPAWYKVSIGNHPRLYAFGGAAPEQITLGPGRSTITLRYEATTDSDSDYGTASYTAVRQYYINGKVVQEVREKEVAAAVGDIISAAQIAAANPAWNMTTHGQFTLTSAQPDSKRLNAGQNTFILRYDLVSASPQIVTLCYDPNGAEGSLPADQSVQYGTVVDIKSASGLKKVGYRFLGWSMDANAKAGDIFYEPGTSMPLTQNTVLYAVWAPENGFIVTYDGNSNTAGRVPVPQSVQAGESLILAGAGTLAMDGFHFCGWGSSKETTAAAAWRTGSAFTPSADTTLYAVWEQDTPGQPVTLVYDLNDGTGRTLDTVSVPAGTGITVTTTMPVREGLTFLGWSAAHDARIADIAPGSPLTVNSNMRLYAVWQEETDPKTLSYDLTGGEGTIPPVKGETVRVSGRTPMREGYRFLGWSTNDKATRPEPAWAAHTVHRLDADTTIYAVWQLAPATGIYTITYDANGGSGAPDAEKGTNIKVSDKVPVKDGYTFLGWSTDPADTAAEESWAAGGERKLTADTNLFAVWHQYILTYTGVEGQTAPQGGGLVTLADEPKTNGKMFSGWMNRHDSKMYKAGEKLMLTGDMLLQPVWVDISQTDDGSSASQAPGAVQSQTPSPLPTTSAAAVPSATASQTARPSASATADPSSSKKPDGTVSAVPSSAQGTQYANRTNAPTRIPEADKGPYATGTNDTSNVGVWVAMCAAAALAIAAFFIMRRKNAGGR